MPALSGPSSIPPWQFTALRVILGLYLAVHFLHLAPWGPELFGNAGVFPDPAINLTHGILPNPLALWDSPGAVRALLLALGALGLLFAAGCARHLAAILLWFGWAALFNRNNLISNPSIPYVGLVLLATLLIPAGEPLSVWPRATPERRQRWVFPRSAYEVVWFLLMAGYTYSGLVKLASPSWMNGEALRLLLDNPLARPGPVRDLLRSLPDALLRIATWAALATEVLALPLALWHRTRRLAWLATGALQAGILLVVDFADLTMGMAMAHLFTFDPSWLPARRSAGKDVAVRQLVLYDGVCGLCDRAVQFLLGEDRQGVLSFAPLQGETAAALRRRHPHLEGADSMVFVRDAGGEREQALLRTTGVLQALAAVGGFWRVVSWLRVVPRPLRDAIYDAVAKRRYRWFGKFDSCRLPAPGQAARFLP